MKRYNHNRSNTRLASGNMGLIYGSCARHCIAGTTLRGGVAASFQLAPMVHQALSQIRVNTWAISAADRILWADAEDFYTGGDTGDKRPEVPYILAPSDGGWKPGSLADSFGFPTGVPGLKTNALPFRLYAMWWNENVRNPELQEELPVATTSGLDMVTNTELQRVNWPKDMFTTATQEQQLGDEVVIPIVGSTTLERVGGTKSVIPGSTGNASDPIASMTYRWKRPGEAGYLGQPTALFAKDATTGSDIIANASGTTTDPQCVAVYNAGLDVNAASLKVPDNTTGVLPSDFNFAMARAKWKSRRNLYGARYKDWLSFLGIRYSDRRLQLPSVLARGRSDVDISGVLQTAPGTNSFVGERAGVGSTYASCNYKTYFEEPTTVIHLWCVRPATVYVNMNPPEWQFEVREDLYTPEFAHVGMVEEKVGTLFPTGNESQDNAKFGWRNRYDEMRVGFNDVAGAFKTTNLSYHQGRVFGTAPALNSDFLECNPSNRIFANLNGEQIEAAAIRNLFIERNMVSPNGNPKF